MPVRRSSPVLALTFSALAAASMLACGPAEAGLQDIGREVQDKTEDLTRKVDDWVNAEPMQQRQDKCREEGGTWAHTVGFSACEDGHMILTVDGKEETQSCSYGEGGEAKDQCVHVNEDGLSYFNDGPSVPHLVQRLSSSLSGDIDQLRYLDLFWPAGVNHDYCYHHGASVYGLDQSECDSQYFSDLSAVCANEDFRNERPWFKQRSCRQVAATHFAAVRAQGKDSFEALETYVVYPAWQPLWQAFGMDHDVIDQELADEIEGKLGKVGLLPNAD